jgi:hypothetical protein
MARFKLTDAKLVAPEISHEDPFNASENESGHWVVIGRHADSNCCAHKSTTNPFRQRTKCHPRPGGKRFPDTGALPA